ncbi:MAG: hypothetical protein RL514_1685 [Verrucomicrobiota bacterium]|jgi:hypothetical protein
MASASPTLFISVVSVGPAGGMVAVRQHLEGTTRNLGDDEINARLEATGVRRSRRFTVRINRTLQMFLSLIAMGMEAAQMSRSTEALARLRWLPD